MRFPIMNKRGYGAVSLPLLDGGLNYEEPMHLIADNQLSDAKNVWVDDGILKTRPALVRDASKEWIVPEVQDDSFLRSGYVDIPQTKDGKNAKLFYKATSYPVTITVDNVEHQVDYIRYTCQLIEYSTTAEQPTTKTFSASVNSNLYWDIPTSECIFMGTPKIKSRQLPNPYDPSATIEYEGTGLFFLLSREFTVHTGSGLFTVPVVELREVLTGTIRESSGTTTVYALERLNDTEYYSPQVYINGKGDSYSGMPASVDADYAVASMFEGHSILYGSADRYCFTTDSTSKTYTLPAKLPSNKVTIEYTDITNGKVYKGSSNVNVSSSEKVIELFDVDAVNGQPSFKVKINPGGSQNDTKIAFYNAAGTTQTALCDALNSIGNNLVVSLTFGLPGQAWQDYYKNYVKPRIDDKLHGAKICESFGGTGKGTRLFFAGNKNYLHWSAVNDFTYISVNNYAAVGSDTQAITALKKQDEIMAVFKEHELYYSQYLGANEISAEQVKLGTVIDVEANSAYFAFFEIHSQIGCDLPNTIQLCGDRLVWVCRDGKAYMLKTANQYSHSNIFYISGMVDRELAKAVEGVTAVASASFDGYYFVVLDNKVFLLDYDNYYYKYSTTYANQKKQQALQHWYIWELPRDRVDGTTEITAYAQALLHCREHLYLSRHIGENVVEVYQFTEDQDEDSVRNFWHDDKMLPIESTIQTKAFSFGAPNRFKKINQLYLGFGEAAGITDITYITDKGEVIGEKVDLVGEQDETLPEYISKKRFLPNITRALKFGVRLVCKGRIAIDDIEIHYTVTGVTR